MPCGHLSFPILLPRSVAKPRASDRAVTSLTFSTSLGFCRWKKVDYWPFTVSCSVYFWHSLAWQTCCMHAYMHACMLPSLFSVFVKYARQLSSLVVFYVDRFCQCVKKYASSILSLLFVSHMIWYYHAEGSKSYSRYENYAFVLFRWSEKITFIHLVLHCSLGL